MKLDFTDKKPIYYQIADFIRNAILLGNYSEGEAIPSIRKLAVDYSINHHTILKGIQILIQEDLLEKERGKGMYVKIGAIQRLKKRETEMFLQKDILNFIQRAQTLKMSKSELLEKINELYEDSNE
jgi:GntR family transcriptional regulator